VLVAARAPLGIDYDVDARPSLLALARGDLSAFAHLQAAMGPVAIALRAPFVALARAAGADALWEYRVGAAVCLVPVGVFALGLARRLLARGTPAYVVVVVVALFALNPLVFNALQAGHPEEPLAGVLAVAAVFAATGGRSPAALVLLALAVATKQSALIAVGPVLFALAPAVRRRAVVVLVAGCAVLLAPFAVGGPGAFWDKNLELLRGSRVALPFSPWWLIGDGDTAVRAVPEWVGLVGRILTLTVPLALAAALARCRRGMLDRELALGLLALASLLRCLLDPADNPYYFLPAIYALCAWESTRRPDLPWLAIVTSGVLWAVVVFPWRDGNGDLVALLSLSWATALTAILTLRLNRARRPPTTPVPSPP
jgi:hypothetical protein